MKRRTDIDWLRVLAMLTIFAFHCARFFDHDGWHVKNNALSVGMSVFVGILAQWIMPLFFVLSAISAFYALSFRKNAQYIHERVMRLFIPLSFGTLVLIPPQVYIERVTQGQFSGSFFEFLPRYFDGFYGFGGNFAWMGLHLWYLEVLFVFSLITLPILRCLKKEPVRRFMGRAAARVGNPGLLLLPAVPIVLMEMLVNLQPQGIGIRDFGGWSLPVYLIFFMIGCLLACDEESQERLRRRWLLALAMGAVTTIAGYLILESGNSSRAPLFTVLRGFNSWFWLAAILGFAGRYLNSYSAFLKYANEAVLPFYILHQTVIVVIGFYLAGSTVGIPAKYLILSATSFIIIVSLYDLLVRRFKALRFLFGMKAGI